MKVSVIGLGYVGSVAAVGLASAGHDVLGIDINSFKIEAYRSERVSMYEPGLSEMMHYGLSHGNLRFLTNDELSEPLGDVVIIATGTPPTPTGAADLSQVTASLSWVKICRLGKRNPASSTKFVWHDFRFSVPVRGSSL